VLLAVLLSCAPNYDPCFTPADQVSDLRVLAIRTDPPQVSLLAQGDPPPVAVSVLIADPEYPAERLEVSGALCAQDACFPGDTIHAVGSPKSLRLSVAPTAAQVQHALRNDPLQGYGGIRLQLRLDVVSAHGQTARGEKIVLFSPPDAVPNQGFEVTAVEVVRTSHEHRECAMRDPVPPENEVLEPGGVLRLDVGDAVSLRPVLSPGAREQYEVTDLASVRRSLREQITYSFYATAHTSFSYNEATEPDIPSPATEFTYLKYAGGEGSLWIVARDDRGAQAWLSLRIGAVDARACYSCHPPGVSLCPRIEVGCSSR
jgi:hypothetical protein